MASFVSPLSYSSDIVFIVGMHRSGTTLLSKLIDSSGYKSGWIKEENNEPKFIIKKNDQMLHAAGCNWENPFDFPSYINDLSINFMAAWLKRELLGFRSVEFWGSSWFKRNKFDKNNNKKWVIKDPRISITFPVWKTLFPEAKVLHIKRHGIDVAASLRERAINLYCYSESGKILPRGFRVSDINYGIKLWSFYEKSCQEIIEGIADKKKYLTIKYEDLILNSSDSMALLSDFLCVDIDYSKSLFDSGRVYAYRDKEELLKIEEKIRNVLAVNGY